VRIVILVSFLLLLSGCQIYTPSSGIPLFGGAGDAVWGRDNLVGKSIDYVKACVGVPTTVSDTEDGGRILEWTTAEPSVPVNVPLPLVGNILSMSAIAVPMAAFTGALSAQVGGGNGRLMIVADNHHIITEIHMAGPADGFTGEDSMIGTDLLRGCRRDVEQHRQLQSGVVHHE
jgi:hypothetical protein